MYKKLLLACLLILVLFVAISLLKTDSEPDNSIVETSEKTEAEKETVRQFWTIYRQATVFRLAGEIEQAAKA